MKTFSKIVGVGSHLPPKIVTNDDISKFVDTSDSWIKERTGISQRHFVEDETCADLAYEASVNALKFANFDAKNIDVIIVATTTNDKRFPSVACQIQHRLGANGCCAFDIQAVCAGFTYALSVADAMIKSQQFKTILVVGSETMSKLMNWEDRSTCILFGDGAGALLLKANNEPGIINTSLHADGEYEYLLHAPYLPKKSSMDLDSLAHLKMDGSKIFKIAVNMMGDLVDETLQKANMSYNELDWLVPHQANIRIINSIAKKLKMPNDRVITTIDQQANTSAASIPLALDKAIQDNKIQRGQKFLIIAFGGGLTWGSALIKF